MSTADPKVSGGATAEERGAGGVVFNPEGDVLILRHASGHWVFPKGHVEVGETEREAAVREVLEEAGVLAECSDDRRWYTSYVNPRGSRRLITWFVCESADSAVRLEERLFREGGFFPLERAAAMLSHTADRELLAAVCAWREGRR